MGDKQPAATGPDAMERGRCFFSLSSNALSYRTKPLCPQSGNPLIVFGSEFVTQEKLELVLKVESIPDEFAVKSVKGKLCFIIERKCAEDWNSRVIRSFGGDPVCCIRKNTYPQVEGFSILSLVNGDPEPVMNLQAKNGKTCNKKMIATMAMDENIGERHLLKISGDLKNRMYGVSWTEPGKKGGAMIAMTWDVCVDGRKTQDRGCAKYVMEIPAGVDAASMVALATAICERDAPELDNAILPLEPQYHDEINAFGHRFLAKTPLSLVMSAKDNRLNVIDSMGSLQFWMDALGVCRLPNGTNIFQLSDDGMSIHGTTDRAAKTEMTFSRMGLQEDAQHLLALISSDTNPQNQVVLVAPTTASTESVVLPIRRVLHLDEQSDALILDGPVVGRIVIREPDDEYFDTWYHNVRANTPSSQLPTVPPDLGIGADISSGIDIAVATAMMLMMIKVSPAAKRMRDILGRIRDFSVPTSHRGGAKEVKARKDYVHGAVHDGHNRRDVERVTKQFKTIL